MSEKISQDRLERQLVQSGLSEKAARIYGVLAQLGNATPATIAQHAGVNRSTAYKILTDLSVKGLISELQRGKKLTYQIESPRRLVRFVEGREKKWKDSVACAQELLPDLEALVSLSPGKPKVRFYQGLEGVKDIYLDHITNQEAYEMLGMSNVVELQDMLSKKFLRDYVREKLKLRIMSRGILPDTDKDKEYRASFYSGFVERYRPKFRYVPHKEFPFQGEITLYGKKSISCINFSPRGMAGVIIEDEVIFGMLRCMFELAWKGAL